MCDFFGRMWSCLRGLKGLGLRCSLCMHVVAVSTTCSTKSERKAESYANVIAFASMLMLRDVSMDLEGPSESNVM